MVSCLQFILRSLVSILLGVNVITRMSPECHLDVTLMSRVIIGFKNDQTECQVFLVIVARPEDSSS